MANQSKDREMTTLNVNQSRADGDKRLNSHTSIVEPSILVYLCRTFTTRELFQLTIVSKSLHKGILENSLIIAQARWEDDYNDVCFPLRLSEDICLTSEGQRRRSWKWVGLHHPTEETHVLPSLTHLPADGHLSVNRIDFDSSFCSLLAISGGLLLFSLTRPDQPWSEPFHGAWNWRHSVHERRWRPLLVSNPLTKTWRELPEPDVPSDSSWDYDGARAHLVVVDEETSTYKVLLLLRDRICVYTSTTMGWSVRSFQQRIPWGTGFGDIIRVGGGSTEYVDVPWAMVGGKLFYAELKVNEKLVIENTCPLQDGQVKVFKVDEEAGTWKPAVVYALRNFFLADLHKENYDFGFGHGSCTIDIVECMGGMYVLIPALLDETLYVSDSIRNMYNLGERMTDDEETDDDMYSHFGFFPIRFYVIQLNGVGLSFGQVLLRRPHSIGGEEFEERSQSLHWSGSDTANKHLRINLDFFDSQWYACKGVGSVINIAFDDYLLEYNVLSGVTTTKILLDRSFAFEQDIPYKASASTLLYRPSFHMKP